MVYGTSRLIACDELESKGREMRVLAALFIFLLWHSA